MTPAPGNTPADTSKLVNLEAQLAASLTEAADEIAHTETLDPEQRAEIYTILEAMKLDAESNRGLMKLLASKVCRQAGNPGDA